MLPACLLLIIAVASGTLLTFLYDRTAPLPARVCMGAATGVALLAMEGFLLALLLGLNGTSVAIAAGAQLLPALLLVRPAYRELVRSAITTTSQSAREAFRQRPYATQGYVLFYCAIAVVLGLVFSAGAYESPQGIFTGIANNLGDLPFHLQVISSFTQGNNFPPEDPTFAGLRFAYPFLSDVLTAMLVKTGAPVISAMWLQNVALALSLTGLMHYWTLVLTRSRLAGIIAPLLVLFSGGFGWTWILMELHNSAGGLVWLLQHLTHDYTIGPDSILRWGNSLTTLFVPQRGILMGVPLAICVFCQWWQAINPPQDSDRKLDHDEAQQQNSPERRSRMIAAGAFAGLLPLVHAHSFLVVMGMAACLALIFRTEWKTWLLFFETAVVVALPQLIWLARTGAISAGSYLGWQPGWDHVTKTADYNVLAFWLVNTGFFIPLLMIALLWEGKDWALPRRLLLFYAPFLLCFIVPNLTRVAPWIWDNIKVLFYWYVASVPIVAWLLARGLREKSAWRWIAGGVLASMILSGALDVFRATSGQAAYLEFSPRDIAAARLITEKAGPRALVLHAPTFNSPVFLTGRRSLLGYPGWIASRGLVYSQRLADIEHIYAGSADADALLRQYHVDYVLISPAEREAMRINEVFWAGHIKVAETPGYRLYQIQGSGEKAER
ncbi:MAG: hypothetical protein LAO20_18835 [Acidobacteriia bacterium]|nr:hypothetical protein [Terriglobia bacterium]